MRGRCILNNRRADQAPSALAGNRSRGGAPDQRLQPKSEMQNHLVPKRCITHFPLHYDGLNSNLASLNISSSTTHPQPPIQMLVSVIHSLTDVSISLTSDQHVGSTHTHSLSHTHTHTHTHTNTHTHRACHTHTHTHTHNTLHYSQVTSMSVAVVLSCSEASWSVSCCQHHTTHTQSHTHTVTHTHTCTHTHTQSHTHTHTYSHTHTHTESHTHTHTHTPPPITHK